MAGSAHLCSQPNALGRLGDAFAYEIDRDLLHTGLKSCPACARRQAGQSAAKQI